MAKSIGITDEELPFKACYPPNLGLRECLGLEFQLPEDFNLDDDDEDEEDGNKNEVLERAVEQASTEDVLNFLAGIDFEEEDMPANATNLQPRSENANDAEAAAFGQSEEDENPQGFMNQREDI